MGEAERKKMTGDFLPAKYGTDKACRDFACEVKAPMEMLRRSGQAAAPVKVLLTGGGALFPSIKEILEEAIGVSGCIRRSDGDG